MKIQIRNLTKKFGDFIALDNVSLDIEQGELIGLLGPSGCGKTTLLRILSGLENADSGTITLDGEDATVRPAGARGVGFVFQHYALFKHMTVFDNIAFGLKVRKKDKLPKKEIERRVNSLLSLIKMEEFGSRYPSQLSGGQRQRVALARALAVEPRVLLLDEPFGALDAKVRKDLRRWLRRLHDDLHVTSVFVTHDVEEALEVSDRVVVMNEGRVEQIGSPEEVYESPKTQFVCKFLGGVNIFHARVLDGSLKIDANSLADDENIALKAYVRPHDMILKKNNEGGGAMECSVTRLQSIGAVARIELRTIVGGNVLEVEMSSDRFAELGIKVGERVFAEPIRYRLFENSENQSNGR